MNTIPNAHYTNNSNLDNSKNSAPLNSNIQFKSIRYLKHSNRNNTSTVYSTLPSNRTTYQQTFSSLYNSSIPHSIQKDRLQQTSSRNQTKENHKEDQELKREPKKTKEQQLNEYYKLKEKEAKVIRARKQLEVTHQRENESIRKRNELRRIRLKVHQLLTNGQFTICPSFEAKNSNYNFSTIDFTTSNFYKKKDELYHSIFRFDKNSHGEAHERFDMMIDLDEIKKYQKKPDDLLKEKLTLIEKEYIKNDPAYFFNNNTLNEENTEMLKVKTLIMKLNQEDEAANQYKKQEPLKRIIPNTVSSSLELTKFLHNDPIVNKKKKSKRTVGPSELEKKKEKTLKALDHQRHRLLTTQLNDRRNSLDTNFVNKEIVKMENLINLSKKQVILNKISLDAIRKVILKKDYNPKNARLQKNYNEQGHNDPKINENAYKYVSLDKRDAEELNNQIVQIKETYKRKGGQRASIIFINPDTNY